MVAIPDPNAQKYSAKEIIAQFETDTGLPADKLARLVAIWWPAIRTALAAMDQGTGGRKLFTPKQVPLD